MSIVSLRHGGWAAAQVGGGSACATPLLAAPRPPSLPHTAPAPHAAPSPSFQPASSSPLGSGPWSHCRHGQLLRHTSSRRNVSARSGTGRGDAEPSPSSSTAAPTLPLRSAASGDSSDGSDSLGTSSPGGSPGPRQVPTVDAVFTTRYGTRFRVRPYSNAEYGAIIDLQSEAFHTLNPVPFLNDFTYKRFRAEVVDALKQKTKYSDPSIFQLLVAEEVPVQDQDQDVTAASGNNSTDGGSSSGGSSSGAKVVGVVEVSLMEDRPVLACLPAGTREYAYVSSMCVAPTARRRGVAQALMSAAEEQARLWGQRQLALHVYRDNAPAVQLYGGCGMAVVNTDPDWKAWFGDRVRLLMHKQLA
ncbi:hypothetical protein HYH02_011902 [Chlamydomonas schloesseri]|uniref:N-acetyltransferase domain-containing protein n=1 Tax=Chlamydomonas schloesseri TaxID=2026947 RepID=A0A835W4K3_9CHLO|nr:hypothetical protein HYH02_011902 [Chlamydomonas schloesseri]|eukprot:KAG2435611.1 hypothetical protein HYH02_011902 [Chlamydomonas schloesseri]